MARQLEAVVVSKKQQKSAIVEVTRKKSHPIYSKQYSVSKRFAIHDEKDVCVEGQKVLIEECRPISKTKKFTLVEVIEG